MYVYTFLTEMIRVLCQQVSFSSDSKNNSFALSQLGSRALGNHVTTSEIIFETYGHPTSATLNRLKKAKVYQNDKNGNVIFTSTNILQL